MPSIIKQQILKPLSRFAKNLDPSQVKLSALRGEVDMVNIELDEIVLMELLDLPIWLSIKSAVCESLSIKIPWTRLRSIPIFIIVDRVSVEIEVLDKPRQKCAKGVPSYRTSTGRYGFVDRVIDGVSLKIHELDIRLTSKAFKASVNLSHILLASRKPNWANGSLQYTSVSLPERGSILIFKEMCWESTRFEADGLMDHMTPVKLITNGARLRVILKKRLSDSSVICGNVTMLVESLLWVLTVSQLEAVVVFLKSIKHCIELSAEQEKHIFTEKAKLLLSGSFAAVTSLSSMIPMDAPSQFGARSSDPRLVQCFDHNDVKENSFHFNVKLVEIHFCEDSLRTTPISTQIVNSGSVRVTLNNLNFDYYPLHPRTVSRRNWPDYSDLHRERQNWLDSLKPASHPDACIARRFRSPDSMVFESVAVCRLQGFTMSRVILESGGTGTCAPHLPAGVRFGGSRFNQSTIMEALDGEQRSFASNAFIASDMEFHKLPPKTDLFAGDLTQCFSFDAENEGLPIILFSQVNPLHFKFDVDTLIWLNAFLLNLMVNLQSLFDEPEEIEGTPPVPLIYCRAEALMPRIIFPMYTPAGSGTAEISEYPWEGPSALVVQIDAAMLQILPQPLPSRMTKALTDTLDAFDRQSKSQSLRKPTWDREHILPAWQRFRQFANAIATQSKFDDGNSFTDLLVCVHCPSLWAEFLTICEAATLNRDGPAFKTYRQVFFDATPVTVWALAGWPLRYRPPNAPRRLVTWQPNVARILEAPPALPEPFSVLVDFDHSANPISVYGNFGSTSKAPVVKTPLRFTIGHPGAVFTFRPVRHLRLPDAVDHLVFLYGLAYRASRLEASLGLDYAEVMGRMNGTGTGGTKRYHEWLLTGKCLVTRGIQMEIASTPEGRFIDAPPGYAAATSQSNPSLVSSSSAIVSTDSSQGGHLKMVSTEVSMRTPTTNGVLGTIQSSPNFSSEKTAVSLHQLKRSDELEQLAKEPRSVPSFDDIYRIPPSMDDNTEMSSVSYSVSTENLCLAEEEEDLIGDDSFCLIGGNSSLDEIIPEEVGIDVSLAQDEQFDRRSTALQDDDMALHFPPWKITRIMLDLKEISLDADLTTVEARAWLGVGTVSFVDPDDEKDISGPQANVNGPEDPNACEASDDGDIVSGEALPASNFQANGTIDPSSAFHISLRLGGDSLPGQPQSLLTPYDGWMSMHVAMGRETTLYPVATTWEVMEALLGALTSRGGVKACRWVATQGHDAGQVPLHNPPELLDLTFCLESGDLVLDLTGRPRSRLNRCKTNRSATSKAPIQKIKLIQGFRAALTSDGVLEVCGAPSRSATPLPPLTARPLAPLSNGPPTPPRQPVVLHPQVPVSEPVSPPSRPPVPSRHERSLAKENARLQAMVDRLNAQVLSLSVTLANFELQHPK